MLTILVAMYYNIVLEYYNLEEHKIVFLKSKYLLNLKLLTIHRVFEVDML